MCNLTWEDAKTILMWYISTFRNVPCEGVNEKRNQDLAVDIFTILLDSFEKFEALPDAQNQMEILKRRIEELEEA